MSRNRDTNDDRSAEEYRHLANLAERLERERPVPSAAFRAELRRRLTAPSRLPIHSRHHRALAAAYITLGLLLLAVAAVGLVGTGPFAA